MPKYNISKYTLMPIISAKTQNGYLGPCYLCLSDLFALISLTSNMPLVRTAIQYICTPGCGKSFKNASGLSSHRSQALQCDRVFRKSIFDESVAKLAANNPPVPHSDDEQPLNADDDAMIGIEAEVQSLNQEDPDNEEFYPAEANFEDPYPEDPYPEDPNFEDAQPADYSIGLNEQDPWEIPLGHDTEDEDHIQDRINANPLLEEYRYDFPTAAGTVLHHEQSRFNQVYKHQQEKGNENIYYPFANEMDWELGAFLTESRMAMSEMDQFLKLSYVSIDIYIYIYLHAILSTQTKARPPSFMTANALHSRIESLPDGGARWVNKLLTPEAGTLKGLPGNQVVLLYRDPVKAIQSLLDRPSLADHMEFAPYRIFCPTFGDDDECTSKDGNKSTSEDDEQSTSEGDDDSASNDDDDQSAHEEYDMDDSASEEDRSSSDEEVSVGKRAPKKKKAAAKKAAAHFAAGGRPGYERRFTEMSTAEYWWRTQVNSIESS
jgi:hypothetical protein